MRKVKFGNPPFLKSESGAALAMVLILIVFISLWMAALAVLVQSSGASLEKNAEENTRRANLVNTVLPLALNQLNLPKRLGVDDVDSNRCDMQTFAPSTTAGEMLFPGVKSLDSKGNPVSEDIVVQCIQMPKSGLTQPIASIVLSGGYLPGSAAGVVGQDGGLSIISSGQGNTPLQITGGIINVSGGWDGVDGQTFAVNTLDTSTSASLDSIPKIIQPGVNVTLAGNCPSSNWTGNSRSPLKCQCPAWSTSTLTNTPSSVICPMNSDGYSYDSIDPLSQTISELRNYIDSVLAGVIDIQGSRKARIPADCSAPTKVTANLWAVQIEPGVVDSSTVGALNSLIANTGCGSGSNTKPAIQFKPGVYLFDFSPPFNSTTNIGAKAPSNTVTFNNSSGVRIIGGEALEISKDVNGLTCDSASERGVQFQFANSSYMDMGKASLILCPIGSQPTMIAPWNIPDNVAPISWAGDNSTPILSYSSSGANSSTSDDGSGCPVGSGVVCLISKGQIFFPAGWINYKVNGNSIYKFDKGLLAKAVTVTFTGSAQNVGNVAPPSPYNGDRVVQLRFWSKTRQQNLGIIQVVIRDYFGRRVGSGYKIIGWRAIW